MSHFQSTAGIKLKADKNSFRQFQAGASLCPGTKQQVVYYYNHFRDEIITNNTN